MRANNVPIRGQEYRGSRLIAISIRVAIDEAVRDADGASIEHRLIRPVNRQVLPSLWAGQEARDADRRTVDRVSLSRGPAESLERAKAPMLRPSRESRDQPATGPSQARRLSIAATSDNLLLGAE